jgi:hypothetical protein
MRRRLAPILAVALALAAAGTGTLAALPAGQYRERADAICATIERDVRRLPPPDAGPEVRPYLDRLLPVLRRAGRRLGALEPPARLAVDHARYLRTGRLSVALFAAMRTRLARGADPVAVVRDAEPRLARLDAQGTAAARALGLEACAREVSAGS